IDPRPRWSASLVSTNVESSRKSIASPCTSSPVMLHTGHPLAVRRPPSPETNLIDLRVRAGPPRIGRPAGVPEAQRRRRRGADRTPPLARRIGLGHGVDDYGSAGPLVIPRVRDVE